jgi:hypothetical protein
MYIQCTTNVHTMYNKCTTNVITIIVVYHMKFIESSLSERKNANSKSAKHQKLPEP